MKKPETKIKNEIYNFLINEARGYWLKMSGSAFMRRGIPDIIGCCPNSPNDGRFVGIEIKTKKGYLSNLQFYNLEQIRASKGLGLVINSWDSDAKEWLLKLLS